MKILVLKKLTREDRQALRGHQIFSCPAIQIIPKKIKLSKMEFDYALITSANAVLGFRPRQISAKQWIAIGEVSRKSLVGIRNVKVLKNSTSTGVEKYFGKQRRGSIFFPRSNLGDPVLVQKLKRRGFRVKVVHAYETRILNIRKKLRKIIDSQEVDAIFVMSPSSFVAVRRALSRKEILAMSIKWVAIGRTTGQSLRKFGLKPRIAREPSLLQMKACIS